MKNYDVLKACIMLQLFLEHYDEISNHPLFRQSIKQRGKRLVEDLEYMFESSIVDLYSADGDLFSSISDVKNEIVEMLASVEPHLWPEVKNALGEIIVKIKQDEKDLYPLQASSKN